ncbi:MAG: hypothetical protein NVSMB51_18280 [Solirubrobacteraceae bacterium]
MGIGADSANVRLQAVRRRWPLIVLFALLALGTALAVSFSSQKQYDATAQLLLVQNGPASTVINPTGSQSAPDPQRDVNTAVGMIKLDSIANSVRQKLGLTISTSALLDEISTSSDSVNSNLVKLTARDATPELASKIANDFAQQYFQFRLALSRQNFVQAANLAQAQLKSLSPAAATSQVGQQLAERARELQIDAALQTGGVQLVSNARVPTAASRPRPALSAAVGLLLGLAIGVGVALGLELLDRRFRDEAAIEQAYGLPIVGGIPRSARRQVARDDRRRQEAYGLLAANLRYASLGSERKVMMITSAAPGEGKTSVTLGLGAALARMGLRVIAIEADLRRPMFAEYVKLEPTAGLARLLGGTGKLSDELIWLDARTLGPVTADSVKEGLGFAILPVGRTPANPQLALSRPSMSAVVDAARSLADVVLIDTPPIGTVSDAVALSRLIDQVLIVARLDVSTREGARRVVRALQNSDVETAGLVIMATRPEDEQYGYYGEPADPDAQAVGSGLAG